MSSLDDVAARISHNRDMCDIGTLASEEMINAAEDSLDVTFPYEYRDFLKRWGTLAIGPIEFYGIATGMARPSAPDGIWFTRVKRKQVGLPKHLIVLVNNNGDEYYCIDTSIQSVCRIVVWDVSSRSILAEKGVSLADVILQETEDFVE